MFGKRNKLTREVLISNSYGASYEDVPEMFDDIILTQSAAPYSIAVARFEDVKEYMWCCEDGIKMQAPFKALDFIVHPDEGIDFEGMPVIDYNKKIDNKVSDIWRKKIVTKTFNHFFSSYIRTSIFSFW